MAAFERRRVTHPHSDADGARQEDRMSADINQIVAQYQRSGTMPRVQRSEPLYGDFTLLSDDLMEITETFARAEDRFMELPSNVRAHCQNDWRVFVQKFQDEAERAALVDAGLVIVDDVADAQAAAAAAAAEAEAKAFEARVRAVVSSGDAGSVSSSDDVSS